MRIGLFTDTYTPDINGVVTSIVTLQNALEAQGHEVYVVTTYPGLIQVQREGKILRLPGLELKQLYGYKLASPLHLLVLEDIKKMNLDILHVHTEFGIGIFARIVSKLLSIPLVYTYHTTYEDYTHYVNIVNSKTIETLAKKAVGSLSRLYGDSCVEVIAPSIKTKEMLERYGIKTDIHVIPTGLDLSMFDARTTPLEKRNEIRAKFGIQPDECLVIFLGRIAKEKSVDALINGFCEVAKRGLKAKLLIVGAGPDVESLQKQTVELKLQDWVFFAGKKARPEVPSMYHSADIFASASQTETQGMTYIEALASGLPVLSKPDDVLSELVYEDKTGFYFDSPTEFADKLEKFISLSNEQKQQMVKDCLEVVKPYELLRFEQAVEKVYEEALVEYNSLFTITSIRSKGDLVQMTLTSPSADDREVLVTLDMYANGGFRRGFHLTEMEVELLEQNQEKSKAYQSCLRKLSMKDRTRKEIYDWLTGNTSLPIKDINEIVEHLELKGLINDTRYTRDAISNMKMMLQGDNKILRNLVKKGIPHEIVVEQLQEYSNPSEEVEHAMKYAKKIMPTIKDKSHRMKKKLMMQKLLAQGYPKEIVGEVMNTLPLVEDKQSELAILRKVATKAVRRYSNRYKSTQLRNNVYRYCLSLGFESEDIYVVMDEMEWNND